MQRINEIKFGSLSSYRYGVESYDSSKVGLGPLMVQTTAAGNENKWAGPMPVQIIRPFEYTTSIPAAYPWAMQWSNSATSQIDWIFLADISTAAITRRIMLCTLDRLAGPNSFNIEGFITITFPSNTATYTIRGLRMTYDLHTAGTVGVSGTAVTGTSTTWQTDRACVGNRIGFGSTDPTQISTWYEISAIGSDSSITLSTTAGTISSGTPYVIEDLRAIVLTTNTTNGGLVVVKGLRKEVFSPTGTAISAATTTDNIRASYWLKDAATITNTTGAGLAIEPATSKQSQICWVLDGTSTMTLFKYNIRAALTLTSGADTANGFLYKTATTAAITGTASQANNGRFAALGHGPGSGSGCIYFTSTTRVYRTKATSTITAADATWISGGDAMTEIPPGSTTTYGASSLLNSLEYANAIDKLIVAVNATSTPFRSYITAYNASNSQLDRVFGIDLRQIDETTADGSTTPFPSMTGAAYSVWSEGGIAYLAKIGTTIILNQVYAIPLSADWEYTSLTNSFIVTPSLSCPDIDYFQRCVVTSSGVIGGSTGKNLGMLTEPYRIWYRTVGISDNSGTWNLLDQTGDMTGVAGASNIQFKIEFRTFSLSMIPARIFSIGVTYNDLSTLSNYQFSQNQSSASSKIFAWRFSTAFGTSVPNLRVRLFDAVSGTTYVDDNTSSPSGTFERSTNGGSSWSSWNNTDKGNETTYIRYTPASLADNVNIRPLLTLL